MKRLLAALLCLLLISLSVTGCHKKPAEISDFETAVANMLNSKKVTYKTKLSYTLNADGAVEMSSSYETETNRLDGNEKIARKTLYYGLPMDESYYYTNGEYSFISFEEAAYCSTMSEEEYASQRADLLFLFFVAPAHYQNATMDGNNLTLNGYDADMEAFLRKCLQLNADIQINDLKIGGTMTKDGDLLSGAKLTASGAYHLCGMDKTFTVSYTISDVSKNAQTVVRPDTYEYQKVTDIQNAKPMNNAYSVLSYTGNFGVEKETTFHLTYAGADTLYTEKDSYAQSTEQETFRFSLQSDSQVNASGTEHSGKHLLRYDSGILYESQDGVQLSQNDETGVLDMYYDAITYYNTSAPTYELLQDVTVQESDGKTTYTYQYSDAEINYMVNSYINHLYDNLDGYIDQSTQTTYTSRNGSMVIDTASGALISQGLQLAVSYQINGYALDCTIDITITATENDALITE